MNEEVNQFTLWEEKNSTDQKLSLTKNEENDKCVTTGEIQMKSDERILNDTTEGIYKIVNSVNGKYYVGSTNNFKKRWICHRYLLKANRHHNTKLQNAWNKYGENSFNFIIVESNFDSLLSLEQTYLDIAKLNSVICYNLSFDARAPWRGKKLSESHRRNVSLALTGKPKTKEHSCKVGLANRGKPSGRTNRKIVKFINNSTGESFVGIKSDFCKLHQIDPRKAYDLLKGGRKSHKGWSIPL